MSSHTEWVKNNFKNLKIDDPVFTKEYIKQNYPNCIYENHSINDTIEIIAEKASPFAICCYEKLGYIFEPSYHGSDDYLNNISNISTFAYIALHHSDINIRNKTLVFIEKWRSFKNLHCNEDFQCKPIDNEKWVKDNLQYLKRDDPDFTFNYVKLNHPIFGCVTFKHILNKVTDTLEELASKADAVIVCCYEKLGYDSNHITPHLLKTTNNISFLAYIALHHSDENIRNKFLDYIKIWRETYTGN